MSRPLWDFENIALERRDKLKVPFEFISLTQDIKSEATNICYGSESGNHEAKGWWRPVFRFEVTQKTFDRFFNSPYGYRAQYLISPQTGRGSNEILISVLIERLIQSFKGDPNLVSTIRNALTSLYSKIWIDEGQHNPEKPYLIVEVKVPEWEAAARESHQRLTNADSSLTTNEVDRIFGVRAPVGRKLKVMGSWIAKDGSLREVPSKERRAEEIRAYGIS